MAHNGELPATGWLTLIARLFFGGVFIYASVDKILHPADFARAVYNYQILPDGLINLTALALPWLELLLGVCLLTGQWLPGAALWSNGLFWAFFLALLFNHYRGLDVHCGCFSTRPDPASSPPTAWYLFRDPIFLLASRTGLRETEAAEAGFDPLTVDLSSWDHKVYYQGAKELHIRLTGDRSTGRLLGVQLVGHRASEVSKRVDIVATALITAWP